MSQQEMGYGELNRDRPQFSYSGYEGAHFDNGYATGSSGQKLSGQVPGRIASAGQRLALAIISILMLMIMTFGLIAVAIATNVPNWAVFPILFILVLFYSAVVIINIVFNRGH